MKIINAYLYKDFIIHKKSYKVNLIAIWGCYLLILLILGYSGIKNPDITKKIITKFQDKNVIQFTLSKILSIGTLIIGFSYIASLSVGALNNNYSNKSESFYRLLPTPTWKYSLSSYISTIVLPILVSFIGGLSVLILSLLISLLFKIENNFLTIFKYCGQYIITFFPLLSIGSFLFMISAIFKKKAWQKIILTILICFFVFKVTNKLEITSINFISNIFNLVIQSFKATELLTMGNIANNLFSLSTLKQIIFSGLFFFIGNYIYDKRKIS